MALRREEKVKKIILILALILSISSFCFAGTVSKEITAVDEWTDPIAPLYGGKTGYLNVSINGTWSGEVTLQRRYSGGDWGNVRTWTTNIEKALIDLEPKIQYRIGSTSYSSGTITVRLGN